MATISGIIREGQAAPDMDGWICELSPHFWTRSRRCQSHAGQRTFEVLFLEDESEATVTLEALSLDSQEAQSKWARMTCTLQKTDHGLCGITNVAGLFGAEHTVSTVKMTDSACNHWTGSPTEAGWTFKHDSRTSEDQEDLSYTFEGPQEIFEDDSSDDE